MVSDIFLSAKVKADFPDLGNQPFLKLTGRQLLSISKTNSDIGLLMQA